MNYSSPSSPYKNFLLILLAIIIIGGAVFVSKKNNRAPAQIGIQAGDTSGLTYTAGLTASTSTVAYIENTIDSDGDGLKDWEEVLWGTKNDNQDSDADGTTDGKEVASGRNPSKHGPDDKVVLVATSTSGSKVPLTTTDTLARGIFAKYMSLRQVGLSTDPESQADGVNDVLRESLKNFTPPVYTLSQLKISASNDAIALRNYGDAVGGAFKFNSIDSRNETFIVKDSIDGDNPAILNELNPIIASYKKMLTALLLIPVPSYLSSAHLGIVNNVATLVYLNENFKKTFTDPVLSLQALGYYEPLVRNFADNLIIIRNALTTNNIHYSASEGGSFLIEP